VWDASAPAVEVPARDSYAIRLVVGRALYDAGRAVSGSPLVAGLARPAELLVHPKDLQRLGVADGEEVRVTSSRTSLRLAVRSGPGVPVGVARLAFSADGTGASELVDSGLVVNDVRLETLR
jgi:anaerobic selenocysteine-containing dehydrogenase